MKSNAKSEFWSKMDCPCAGPGSRSWRIRGLVLIIVASTPQCLAPAFSQNLLTNPEFNTAVDPWHNFSEENGTSEWNQLDVSGSPKSGSLLVTNFSGNPIANGAGAAQRVAPIEGGGYYGFGAHAFIPSGQPIAADVAMEVNFYSNSTGGCSGFVGGRFAHAASDTGSWQEFGTALKAPSQATCAEVSLETYPNGVGLVLQAYFDNVRLRPALFSDSFDSGNTSGWSSTSP